MTDLHPVIEQISPSEEQLPAVVARGCDVAVTAGAGAGKTRTLVARYLSLLVDDLPLRGVVAITFTRKAAREMRNRVRREVRRALETESLPEEERPRWRAIYERLDAARIGTIHSLCAEILRHHPAEMGVDPRFQMVEEGQMALLQARAVDAALAEAADDPEMVGLFPDFGERALRKAADQLLKQRLDVREARADLPADVWRAWRPALLAPIQAFVDDADVQSGFARLATLRADGTLDGAAAAGDALAPDLREALAHWDVIEAARAAKDWVAVSRHLAPLRDRLKQKGRKANWAPAAPKAIIADLQGRYDEHLRPYGKKHVDLALDRRLAQEVIPALLRLHDRATAHYARAKERERGLDFDDLEAQALELLRGHPAVRAYWQDQIEALLVDEFQDTNARQRDILDLLNGDQGKLFFVGDAKQSIYRFRGADVTVFREERQAVEARGAVVELSTSYRAHRALVQALNGLLRPVLGDREDPERPYLEPFAPLRHHREEPAAGLTPPYVELHLAAGSKSQGALDRAAQALAARLAALVEEDILLERPDPDTGHTTERPLDFGDVAILCRASTAFAAYETALEEAGIPFLTIAGRGFYDRPEVRDLLNALQGLAQPTDDLALVGLLRSPAIGLSDMALYRLRRAQWSQGLPSLWALLRQEDLSFLDEEAERAADARALIGRLHRSVGRVRVADVLKDFLDATAYRAALLRAGESRAANNVAKLLADAHASDVVGVDGFVAYVAELRDVAPREGEARAIGAGAVQIMTVHQAKGLEFPVVAIGDAARSTPRSGGVLVDRQLGVVPPLSEERLVTGADGLRQPEKVTCAAHHLAQEVDRDQEAAESDRLLYVAATRAREMLLISGTVGVRKSGGLSTSGWLDRLDESLGLSDNAPPCASDGGAVHCFTLDVGDQPVRCEILEPEVQLVPAAVARQAETPSTASPDENLLEPLAPLTLRVDEAVRDADRDPPRRVWRVVPEAERAWAPSWVVGKMVHLALAHWMFPDDEGLDFDAWAGSQARSAGVTEPKVVRDAVRRAARVLTRFRRSPLYGEMATAEQRLHEVPYTRLDDQGRLECGAIDALFRSKDGWVLVEFKTDRVQDRAGLQTALVEKDYVRQVGRYLDAAESILDERPRPVLCLLNYRGHTHLVEDRW